MSGKRSSGKKAAAGRKSGTDSDEESASQQVETRATAVAAASRGRLNTRGGAQTAARRGAGRPLRRDRRTSGATQDPGGDADDEDDEAKASDADLDSDDDIEQNRVVPTRSATPGKGVDAIGRGGLRARATPASSSAAAARAAANTTPKTATQGKTPSRSAVGTKLSGTKRKLVNEDDEDEDVEAGAASSQPDALKRKVGSEIRQSRRLMEDMAAKKEEIAKAAAENEDAVNPKIVAALNQVGAKHAAPRGAAAGASAKKQQAGNGAAAAADRDAETEEEDDGFKRHRKPVHVKAKSNAAKRKAAAAAGSDDEDDDTDGDGYGSETTEQRLERRERLKQERRDRMLSPIRKDYEAGKRAGREYNEVGRVKRLSFEEDLCMELLAFSQQLRDVSDEVNDKGERKRKMNSWLRFWRDHHEICQGRSVAQLQDKVKGWMKNKNYGIDELARGEYPMVFMKGMHGWKGEGPTAHFLIRFYEEAENQGLIQLTQDQRDELESLASFEEAAQRRLDARGADELLGHGSATNAGVGAGGTNAAASSSAAGAGTRASGRSRRGGDGGAGAGAAAGGDSDDDLMPGGRLHANLHHRALAGLNQADTRAGAYQDDGDGGDGDDDGMPVRGAPTRKPPAAGAGAGSSSTSAGPPQSKGNIPGGHASSLLTIRLIDKGSDERTKDLECSFQVSTISPVPAYNKISARLLAMYRGRMASVARLGNVLLMPDLADVPQSHRKKVNWHNFPLRQLPRQFQSITDLLDDMTHKGWDHAKGEIKIFVDPIFNDDPRWLGTSTDPHCRVSFADGSGETRNWYRFGVEKDGKGATERPAFKWE